MNIRTILLALSISLITLSFALSQGTKSDYERAANLRQLTRNKVFRDRVDAHWIDGSACFWYRVQTGSKTFEYVFVDADDRGRELAFDHGRLAKAISAATNTEVDPVRLNLKAFRIDADRRFVSFATSEAGWKCDLATYELTKADEQDEPGKVKDSLPALSSVQRSGDQGAETYVRFVNKLDEPLQLYWIDSSGNRKHYGEIAAGKDRDQHTFAGHVWLLTNKKGKPVAVFRATDQRRDAIVDGSVEIDAQPVRRKQGTKQEGSKSPDGKWTAFARDNNVFVRNRETDAARFLSENGTDDDPFVGRFRWSPDSRKLVAIQQRVGETREVHMVESSPTDQLQPILHTMVYAKPGDKLPVARPRLFDIESLQQIEVSDKLFPNAWRISDVRWQPDSRRFTFQYNQRGHQILRIVVVDAGTGEAAALVNEESETFIDYAYKTYSHQLDQTNELIWMSERDGWNHLYLYDSRTGQVKNQITSGPWVVRGVERVDAKERRLWFRASGVYPEQDPYYLHYGFVDFDGSNLTFLTSGNGTHKIEYSPDRTYYVDSYSRVDMPPVTELRRSTDGSLACELERGDWSSLAATGWKAPERFVAKGRDGETDIHGVIYRPTNFDESKTYPVVEKIYAGPHGSFVPKSFASFRREQTYAELGFIVVQIDGMGTSNRSKAFHNVCWQNLGDSGFPDRILWMQAAAKEYPQMDISSVGIYGGSAGGQSTLRALLAHGDFYDVGVADCGCHDNRMDKVWWNELWMGWPIGPHYQEQSNVNHAHRLTGKLMLTVGELDRNVDPASTMQVVNALIKADKDFDLLIVPGAGHGVGETPYANRRRQDFFVRHLWNAEPRRPDGSGVSRN